MVGGSCEVGAGCLGDDGSPGADRAQGPVLCRMWKFRRWKAELTGRKGGLEAQEVKRGVRVQDQVADRNQGGSSPAYRGCCWPPLASPPRAIGQVNLEPRRRYTWLGPANGK